MIYIYIWDRPNIKGYENGMKRAFVFIPIFIPPFSYPFSYPRCSHPGFIPFLWLLCLCCCYPFAAILVHLGIIVLKLYWYHVDINRCRFGASFATYWHYCAIILKSFFQLCIGYYNGTHCHTHFHVIFIPVFILPFSYPFLYPFSRAFFCLLINGRSHIYAYIYTYV